MNLYHEIRGQGPAVLLIAGATGDAGHFEKTAELLAAERTVITYDRRGNSRSAASGPTTLEEQADDAAALLRHIGVVPEVIFGTSGGAVIALALAVRHPRIAAHLVVHEPPFMQVVPDAVELGQVFEAKVKQALAAGGPRGAMELFIRENAGSEVFDALEPRLRERMVGNGPRFFEHELAMFTSWVPGAAELASLRMPVTVLAGRDNRGNYHHQAAEWLAGALGVGLIEIPGRHAPYLANPREFAAALLPLLAAAGSTAARS